MLAAQRLPGIPASEREDGEGGDAKTDGVEREKVGQRNEGDENTRETGAEHARQSACYIHQAVGGLQRLRVSRQRGQAGFSAGSKSAPRLPTITATITRYQRGSVPASATNGSVATATARSTSTATIVVRRFHRSA